MTLIIGPNTKKEKTANVKGEIYNLIGNSSRIIQIILWTFCYHTSIFVTIPHISDPLNSNKTNKGITDITFTEVILTFVNVLFLIINIRHGYLAATTKSYLEEKEILDLVLKEKEHEKLIEQDLNIKRITSTCKKCEKIRNLRDKHCSICQKCVLEFDHHCILLNNCIGKRNYRFFLAYIILTVAQVFLFIIENLLSIYYYFLEFQVRVSNNNQKHSDPKINALKSTTLGFDLIMNFPVRGFTCIIICSCALLGVGYILLKNIICIYKEQTECERTYKINHNLCSFENYVKENNENCVKVRTGVLPKFFFLLKKALSIKNLFEILWIE